MLHAPFRPHIATGCQFLRILICPKLVNDGCRMSDDIAEAPACKLIETASPCLLGMLVETDARCVMEFL